jgi:CBS domain containing-hemolysin-like protein
VGDLRGELGCAKGGVWIDDDGATVADGRALACDVHLDGVAIAAAEETTVAAWIVGCLGRLAIQGDVVKLGDWEVVVDEVRARRVHRARFRLRQVESSDSADRTSVPPMAPAAEASAQTPTRPSGWSLRSRGRL